MRILLVSLLLLPATAEAKEVTKNAHSNVSTRMYTYFGWDKNCQSTTGIVKLVSKPLNGELKTSEVEDTINISRHTQKTSKCAGTPIKGFRIDYTSNPGFKGNDRFVIEVRYKNKKPELDTFTVTVN